MPQVQLSHLEDIFPKLAIAGYEKTSDQTGGQLDDGSYNCIAWAAEDVNHKFWWPNRFGYWLPWVRRENSVRCFVKTFRWLGYFRCKSSRRELGFDKVALYAIHCSQQPIPPPTSLNELRDWTPTHMARQLSDGTWTSKCGCDEDINHFLLDALKCHGPTTAKYGSPVIYMKRLVPISWIIRKIQRIAWAIESSRENP